MSATRLPAFVPTFRQAIRSSRDAVLSLLLGAFILPASAGVVDPDALWQGVTSTDGSAPTHRHEAGAVAVAGRLYLLGGRGVRPLEVYDPDTGRWSDLGPLPDELHHFQPVAIGKRIYIVAAMRCCYPREPIERTVHVYDTVGGSWSTAGALPAGRERGGAGTVVRNGLIYLVGGNRLGHDGGAVPWFDVFDPASGTWLALADSPNARDHFTAVLAADRLVAAGGRQTDLPDPFDKTVRAVDVYDFERERWTEGADIPTPRAGTMAFAAGDEVVVAGGEVSGRGAAYDTVEAYSVSENRWRTLAPMIDPRHGGGGAVIGDTLHVVAGSSGRGGGPEIAAHETLALASDAPDDTDTDDDGLDDAVERDVWQTDPAKADTDEDGLEDGDETVRGTDPLVADSDTDGLSDGTEIDLGTDPLVADSDEDGLDDGAETALHETDPLIADSDADGLVDGDEIDRGTDPKRADSDGDGLPDGAEAFDHGTDPLRVDTDDDGLDDDEELGEHGTDPLRADSDGDGLDDSEEVALGTDPRVIDSDFDGDPDGSDPDPLVASAGTDGGEGSGEGEEEESGGEGGDAGDSGSGSGGGGAVVWSSLLLVGFTWLRGLLLLVSRPVRGVLVSKSFPTCPS